MRKGNIIAPIFGASFVVTLFAVSTISPTTNKEGNVLEANADIDITTFDSSLTNLDKTENFSISSREAQPVIEKVADLSQKYSSTDKYFYVASDSFLYSSDTTASEVLSDLPYGTYVHCIGYDKYTKDGYSKIEVEGTIGYIHTSELTTDVLFTKSETTTYTIDTTIVYDSFECKTKSKSIGRHKPVNTIAYNNEIGIYEVELSTGNFGYIKYGDVSTEMLFDETDKILYAKSDISIYENYTTDSNTITTLSTYDKIKVIGVSSDWAKVSLGDTFGYTKLCDLQETIPRSIQAVQFAYDMLGVKYVWGGASKKGTDCSGLTMQCYAAAGIYLPHSASAQNNCGTKVSLSEAKPGDLITWSNNGRTVGHVGIYIGNGNMIHASSGRGQVMISNVVQYSKHTKLVSVVRITDE